MSSFVPQGPGADARPDVSIIIPVFNKLSLTTACLESIRREGSAASYEIVVVDNGSTDGSREWLAGEESAGRLRAVISPENLGFARGGKALRFFRLDP